MLTEDTRQRLEKRQEALAVLFIDQSNPDEWRDLSTSTRRGDVYWMKKNAAQTLGLVVRLQSLLAMHEPDYTPPINPEGDARDLESMADQAERDAVALMERVSRKK